MQSVPRLFNSFEPKHYNLHLNLNRPARTFTGHVIVQGAHLSQHDPISLHAKGLEVQKVFVDKLEATYRLQPGDDLLVITPTEGSGGDIQISIDFSGKITDSMHGLYPCYYEVEGEKQELLATQFESHHAREVFPCVDEPEAKATFDLTLTTEKNVAVLGNMPVHEQLNSGEQLVTTFETSPHMSPYLLAFVVGDLHTVKTKTKDGVDVAVWATKAQSLESLNFALDTAKRSIEFFNDYFGTDYPLPKCDHVALPDFSSGAMENWGLITYREVCLLADQHSAISTREYVATVIAHETSHQWFGNLVTMKWWDDLWLNESFATLMEYVCIDNLFPKWNIWMNFATHEVLSAQRRDYLPGVQAIKTTVNHPDEISTLFDPSIVYAKGARVLAMLREYVGETDFQKGLKRYFEEFKYKNTQADDLWKSLVSDARPDVSEFMSAWLEQSGMPRVRASESDGAIKLTQSRFLIPHDEKDHQTWPIPLSIIPSSLNCVMDDSYLSLRDDGRAIWLNHGAVTHMVTDYDDKLRKRLYSSLDTEEIDEIDRLTLLHDTSLVMRAGNQSAVNTLELAMHYSSDRSEPVWDIVSLVVADLRKLIEGDEDAERKLKTIHAELAASNFERLGWVPVKNEPEEDAKLRATIISMLVYAEDDAVIAEGLKQFHASQDLRSLDGELRSIIYVIAVRHGTDDDRKRLLDLHASTSSSELQNDIASALCSSRDEAFLGDRIASLKDENIVRRQDLFRWYYALMSNRYSREMTWRWLIDNWSWIEKTFGGDKSYDDFARYSAAALTTPEWLQTYTAFFANKASIPALKRAIELGIADISTRAAWYERDATDFRNFLKTL